MVEMEGSKFTKLCRDSKLVDGKCVTTTDVDLIFAKVQCASHTLLQIL